MERPIRYIRESFFYGREFVSDDDLNARVLRWLDSDANVRIHGTLKERPADRFERERSLLTPLTPWPYRLVVPRPDPQGAGRTTAAAVPPAVDVQHRPLDAYAKIAGEVQ